MNRARGETELSVDGREARLCLTLGALAEIEDAFGSQSFSDLQRRLAALSASDLRVVLMALLRGGDEDPALAERAAPGPAAKAIAEAFRLGLQV